MCDSLMKKSTVYDLLFRYEACNIIIGTGTNFSLGIIEYKTMSSIPYGTYLWK
jgi:hypothetical protein